MIVQHNTVSLFHLWEGSPDQFCTSSLGLHHTSTSFSIYMQCMNTSCRKRTLVADFETLAFTLNFCAFLISVFSMVITEVVIKNVCFTPLAG